MKQLIGHKCKIHIERVGVDLFYEAIVQDINNTHIWFRDRLGKHFIFQLKDVREISNIV